MWITLCRSSGNPSSAIISLEFNRSAMTARFSSPAESPICVDAFYRPTHRARSRGARRSSLHCFLRGAVRPVIWTGQTGRRVERRRSDERSPGRDPVGASAHRVALGSAGQLGHRQTPWKRRKNACQGWKRWSKGKR
jgi:hypothetical protein